MPCSLDPAVALATSIGGRCHMQSIFLPGRLSNKWFLHSDTYKTFNILFSIVEEANKPRPRPPMRTCSLPLPSGVAYLMPPVALPLESSPFLYSSDGIALSSGSAESSGFRFWRLQASGSLRSGSGLTPLPCCLKCTGGGVCSHSCHSHSHCHSQSQTLNWWPLPLSAY